MPRFAMPFEAALVARNITCYDEMMESKYGVQPAKASTSTGENVTPTFRCNKDETKYDSPSFSLNTCHGGSTVAPAMPAATVSQRVQRRAPPNAIEADIVDLSIRPVRTRKPTRISLDPSFADDPKSNGQKEKTISVKKAPSKGGRNAHVTNQLSNEVPPTMAKPRNKRAADGTVKESTKGDSKATVSNRVRVKPPQTINWTTEKTERLLNLFRTQGFNGDYEKLAKHFSDESSDSLRYFFHTLHQKNKIEPFHVRIHETYGKEIKAIREDVYSQTCTVNIPLMFKFFADFEKHPDPAACGGVDYPAIYRCVGALMRGHVPPTLNALSAAKVKQLLDDILDMASKYRAKLPCRDAIPTPRMASEPRTQDERIEILRRRRSHIWSEEELEAKHIICTGDIHAVRKFYLERPCFNPFNLPLNR